jgi:hypothetical protein
MLCWYFGFVDTLGEMNNIYVMLIFGLVDTLAGMILKKQCLYFDVGSLIAESCCWLYVDNNLLLWMYVDVLRL